MQKNRIAIVEDNTTARINLRSHLITMENLEISSYSNGKELRNGLRTKNFEVIFIDFHLGQNKNGVEWAQSLLESEILNPSTSLIFITSDRLPQTIGQILDLHPDMILLKPYTIKSVVTALRKCLAVRSELLPALDFLDKKNRN
ncbi:response regulator [Glaciecola sp. KUL10]|uniref:response regulator n=1 Tax=Glaciecola sp. (strain KUL10) TaxID=2161813 RepID=UPI000D78732F|nr:response regulator [Glaciecola sp. KUL10]GBL02737.1 response regulator receiver protein [Glaciecola sp. KUL10]